MKVGTKVKVVGGYSGDLSERTGVITRAVGDTYYMVASSCELPEHYFDSDKGEFHLCFLQDQLKEITDE